MAQNVKFYQGSEANYLNKWAAESVNWQGVIYFATDTHNLFLNGNIYGSGDIDSSLLINEDDNTASLVIGDNTIDASALLNYNQTKEPTTSATMSQIGALAKGTTKSQLQGKSISDILDMILFEDVQPTVTSPGYTLSFSISPSSTVEVGTTQTVSATATFKALKYTYGTDESDSYAYSGIIWNSGTIAGTTVETSEDNSSIVNATYSFSSSITVAEGNNTAVVSYTIKGADAPKTSKGNTSNVSATTDITSSKSASFTGAYKPYATTSDVDTYTKINTWLPTSGSKDIEVSYTASETSAADNCLKFAVPAEFTVTSIKKFNTATNAYDATEMLNSAWAQQSNDVSLAAGGSTQISYIPYWHTGNTNNDVITSDIKFKFTVKHS